VIVVATEAAIDETVSIAAAATAVAEIGGGVDGIGRVTSTGDEFNESAGEASDATPTVGVPVAVRVARCTPAAISGVAPAQEARLTDGTGATSTPVASSARVGSDRAEARFGSGSGAEKGADFVSVLASLTVVTPLTESD
jgi:hypothetical protein